MKRILHCAVLIAWLGGVLLAQNPAETYSLDALTRVILEHLDKTGVSSGILLQQSPIFVHPFRYDGVTMSDSNRVDAGRFGKLYGQFRAASIDQPALPAPDAYLNELKRLSRHPVDTIPFALMAMQYDYIRKDAFDLGLIQWNNDQKAFTDVPGRSLSPYLRDTLFAFSAMIQQACNRHVIFRLPSNLMFNNLGWTVGSVEIDFGNGSGWRTVQPDECVELTYGSTGAKTLRLRLLQNGRYWQGHSILTVPGGILSTPRQILQDLVIQNGAELWINRKDRIAYTSNIDNPQNIRPQAFFVTVPGDRCVASQKVVVTIEDGGKLIVGDNEDSPENTGGLYFTSASELYAYGANPIILEDNAELIFAKDSRIELKTGVELLAKTDVFIAATKSTFNMESGSKVIFESTGDFRLDNTSIEVPEGSEIALLNGTSLSVTGQTSVLRIHTGATLRLSGESVANIGPNATLILDPGAIVILESPESHIRIEGTLVYNGDFNFSGLGHFRFAATHTLEFGPNAIHFSLSGAEPYHRFIYLEDGATLHIPDNIDLLLNKGGVEYAGGAAIKLGTGSNATCTFVKFYGGGGSPCLYGPDRPGDIALGDCRFEQVLQPMQFQGGLGSNPFNMENSIDVQRTQFSGYSLGAYIGARQGVAFTDCVFDGGGTGAAAGYALASDGNFFTLMRACQISGHSTGDPASNISANDVMTDPTLRQGVDLNGGFLFWMDGGQIDHCDIGIDNRALGDPGHVPANVILNNMATLDGCTAGLSMEGDATRGLVVASCARITWNVFGISGSDITLLIDPTLMTATPSFTPKPTHF